LTCRSPRLILSLPYDDFFCFMSFGTEPFGPTFNGSYHEDINTPKVETSRHSNALPFCSLQAATHRTYTGERVLPFRWTSSRVSSAQGDVRLSQLGCASSACDCISSPPPQSYSGPTILSRMSCAEKPHIVSSISPRCNVHESSDWWLGWSFTLGYFGVVEDIGRERISRS
jgi:hypothetical protein